MQGSQLAVCVIEVRGRERAMCIQKIVAENHLQRLFARTGRRHAESVHICALSLQHRPVQCRANILRVHRSSEHVTFVEYTGGSHWGDLLSELLFFENYTVQIMIFKNPTKHLCSRRCDFLKSHELIESHTHLSHTCTNELLLIIVNWKFHTFNFDLNSVRLLFLSSRY